MFAIGDRFQDQVQALGDVVLDDVLGKPELARDLPLRKSLDFSQPENFPATIWQLIHQHIYVVQVISCENNVLRGSFLTI